jgi:hypothetical protein
MSGPFLPETQPLWSVFPSLLVSSQEIGYGEGGYGEDGYDTPSFTATNSRPNWIPETIQ